MEVQWKESSVPVCQELCRLIKTAQLTVESVVPDTKADIGRILSVRPQLYLKSKELGNKSASVGGELVLGVLYIDETGTAVSFVSLSKSFAMDYELPFSEDGDQLQVRLSLAGLQARAPNPRKISVDAELYSELTCSRRAAFTVSQELPEGLQTPVHLQTEEVTACLQTVVCEKSFSVNEQLPFPEGTPHPTEILSRETEYRITDSSAVAGRYLVKGEARLRLLCLCEDSPLPCSRDFVLPFSQLIDLDGAEADDAELWAIPSSDYVTLIDTIEGQSLLDAELHAVLQLKGRRRQALLIITDAYSNQMPCECQMAELSICEECLCSESELNAQESLELPEEGREQLSVFTTLFQSGAGQGTVTLDLLCRDREEKLFAMRRSVTLAPPAESETKTCGELCLTECELRQEGKELRFAIRAQSRQKEQKQRTLSRVLSLNLNEEQQFDLASYPAVTAVWAKTESIWELAKQYHSSPEAVLALNADPEKRPLFLPKTK